ncbi:hypothetical protein DXG01_013514 [Tephrocybe rancida]|nr:hypothetical protein DXG01_013514 [Tephrocybe rancida]
MNFSADVPRGWNLHESISTLQNTVARLITYPESYPLFNLRLLPVTIERAALLAQAEYEERVGIERARNAYEEDREQVEEEWRKGRERLRERLLEGIEERRRRARDEKEGEGTSGDSIMDSSSRIHITRKLRNKPGASPPPTPLDSATYVAPESSLLNTARPYSNPHSLSVDDLPSPFPIPLTTTTAIAVPQGGGGPINAGSRRRPKNNGGGQQQPAKILAPLAPYKYEEIEDDLNEIRRGNKRRRTMAVPVGKMGVV